MMYTILKKQLPLRDTTLDYDTVAPGLYEGETAVQLDTGERVAVAVSSRWLQNGAGVSFKGWGRQITEDGSTMIGPEGQEIATQFVHSESPVTVDKFGLDAISKETLMAILGEMPTIVEWPSAPGEDVVKMPMVNWSEELKLNVNIRVAIAHAKQTNPLHDVTSLLAI